MDAQPTLDRVFLSVLPYDQKTLDYGDGVFIIIPETVDNTELAICRVEAVTKGYYHKSGMWMEPAVKVGEVVVIGKRAGVMMSIEGERILVVHERDLWGTIDDWDEKKYIRV